MWRGSLVLAVAIAAFAGCHGVFELDEITPACTIEACQAAGGTCGVNDVCELECTAGGPCVCPAGLSCQLDVRTSDGIVDCSAGKDCSIRCLSDGSSGKGLCRGSEIRCGEGTCRVICTTDQFSCTDITLLCGLGPCSLDCDQLGSCQDASSVSCGLSEDCSLTCGFDACNDISVSCEQLASCRAECTPEGNYTCNGASFSCQDADACALDCAGRPGCTS